MSEGPRRGEADLPAPLLDDKVVEGREGRLFLANDHNHVLDQHSGRLRFTDDQLRQWRIVLETRIAWLERRGVHHHFLIAPNAHSVYPELLPDGVPSAPERPVHQLLGHLRENDSFVRVIYPLETLMATGDTAFAKTGSHWSPYGAWVASQALVDEIRRDVAVDGLPADAIETGERIGVGDLGAKMRPQRKSAFAEAEPRAPRAQAVADNRVRNTGRRIEYEWESGEARPHCLVYGDPFAVGVCRFLAESFPRLTYVHMVNLDFDLVRTLEPDVVVKVMNERFLISVPQDAPARTHEQLQAEKILAGDLISRPVPRTLS